MRYEIRARQGATLGTYEGETALDALDAMARDAGCEDHAASVGATDVGALRDYETAEEIRIATSDEVARSIRASRHDGGAGVISVDGRRCYVEIDETAGLIVTPVADDAS